MKVEQISVFIENEAGRLAQVTRILGEAGINIRGLSLADTSDFGILRLIVSDPGLAKNILRTNGFTINETGVIAIEVEDKPGGLANVLLTLAKAGQNVEYMYAILEKSKDKAVIILRFDNIDEAIAALLTHGVSVLRGEEVYSL